MSIYDAVLSQGAEPAIMRMVVAKAEEVLAEYGQERTLIVSPRNWAELAAWSGAKCRQLRLGTWRGLGFVHGFHGEAFWVLPDRYCGPADCHAMSSKPNEVPEPESSQVPAEGPPGENCRQLACADSEHPSSVAELTIPEEDYGLTPIEPHSRPVLSPAIRNELEVEVLKLLSAPTPPARASVEPARSDYFGDNGAPPELHPLADERIAADVPGCLPVGTAVTLLPLGKIKEAFTEWPPLEPARASFFDMVQEWRAEADKIYDTAKAEYGARFADGYRAGLLAAKAKVAEAEQHCEDQACYEALCGIDALLAKGEP